MDTLIDTSKSKQASELPSMPILDALRLKYFQEHWVSTLQSDRLYSTGSATFAQTSFVPFKEYLTEPALKRKRVSMPSLTDDVAGQASGADAANGSTPPPQTEQPLCTIGKTFFSVTRLSQSGKVKRTVRLPVGCGTAMSESTMFLCRHGAETMNGEILVKAAPWESDTAHSHPIKVLASLAHLKRPLDLQDELFCFTKGLPMYSVASVTGSAEVCTELVRRGAFPNAFEQAVASTSFDSGVVHALLEKGVVQTVNHDCLLFTEVGACEALRNIFYRVQSQRLVKDVLQHSPLEDCTVYELMSRLELLDWSWEPIPRPTKAKPVCFEQLVYQADAPKIWRSTAKQILPEYLRCLLKSDELISAGCEYIPHIAAESVYSALLRGDFDALQQVSFPQLSAKHKPLALGLDIDLGHDALADFLPSNATALGDVVQAEDGGEDWWDLDTWGPMEEWIDAVASALELAEPSIDDEPDHVEPAAPTPEPVVPAPASQLVADARESEALVSLENETKVGRWGSFRVTYHPGRRSHGFFEAECSFHRRNYTSGCKRTFIVKGPELHQRHASLRLCLHWCSLAPQFPRQRTHLRCPLFDDDAPKADQLSMLLSQLPTPPDPVKTDEDHAIFYKMYVCINLTLEKLKRRSSVRTYVRRT